MSNLGKKIISVSKVGKKMQHRRKAKRKVKEA